MGVTGKLNTGEKGEVLGIPAEKGPQGKKKTPPHISKTGQKNPSERMVRGGPSGASPSRSGDCKIGNPQRNMT